MSNMNEEKEKAYNYCGQNCEHELGKMFDLAFDAGVKAERERILKILNTQSISVRKDADFMTINRSIRDFIFPQIESEG